LLKIGGALEVRSADYSTGK
jgi:hypothetical protein